MGLSLLELLPNMSDEQEVQSSEIKSLAVIREGGDLTPPDVRLEFTRFGIDIEVIQNLRRINDALLLTSTKRIGRLRISLAPDAFDPVLFVQRVNFGGTRKVTIEVDDRNCVVEIPPVGEYDSGGLGIFSNEVLKDFVGKIYGPAPIDLYRGKSILEMGELSEEDYERGIEDKIGEFSQANIDSLPPGQYFLRTPDGHNLLTLGVRLQPGHFRHNLWSMYSYSFMGPREKLEIVVGSLAQLLEYDPIHDPEVAINPKIK